MDNKRLRFNKEYFGYLVGYPSGDIFLARATAEAALMNGASIEVLKPFFLDTLEVKRGFHLRTPPLIWLEITKRCNLRCPHCYIDGGLPRESEMSDSEVHDVIDDLADMGVWAVAFTGGEPTLRPSFKDFVVHAHNRGLLIGIATNGMFLTESLLDTLPREGVIISVSWDDLHVGEAHTQTEFALATKAILLSQKMGFLTNIMTNTHRGNIDNLGRLMDWAEGHDVSVRSVPFSPLGRGKHYPFLENTINDVDKAAQFWLRECLFEHKYHQKAGLCVGSIFNYGLTLGYMTRRCSSGRYLAYISADGTVYPCTMCAGEKILSPGNVRNVGFQALWNSHWMIRDYNWDSFESTCKGCPVNEGQYYCASRCPAMSHARHGSYFKCGASHFEKRSTIVRTGMLQRTPTGQGSGLPLVEGN